MNPIYKPVQLDVQTHKNLTLLAKRHKRSIKQFTIDMIQFFEKTGIDPADAKASSLTEAVQNLKSETLKINQLNQEIQTLHDTIKRGFTIVTDNQQGYTNSTKDALNLLMAEIIKINQ
ncbi:BfmA/BtgA family mobilization protein [Chondrinema litorale]|uniref:BfmA/BtgA family mobilization protein n=1 Tax=Chondrinema litorale TaxID=2994555 RepID=UPI00254280D4|nr:BfmA/BtgA family mobilization protein [Chondrinema litorale]UZR99832.1 BfmA/BtgA family mobilization protein [Chondrinema litorale]